MPIESPRTSIGGKSQDAEQAEDSQRPQNHTVGHHLGIFEALERAVVENDDCKDPHKQGKQGRATAVRHCRLLRLIPYYTIGLLENFSFILSN